MNSLANLARPTTIDDVIGQSHIIDFLQRMKKEQKLFSLLFYGPPGIGKTTLAKALANDLHKTSYYFNASTGSKSDLVEMIKTNDIIVLDEIHRLNKDKQDILLPAIEFGKVHVFATTTENPFFVVNPALRSRMHILELKPLNIDEITSGLTKAITRLGLNLKLTKTITQDIAIASGGDFRQSLNILDIITKLYGNRQVDKKLLTELLPTMHFYSDRSGDGHYDLLSAFHKSLRGSDVDASLYYLAKLIASGDILGMERRMMAVAYEDIGLASPNVPMRVVAAIEAAKRLGFPEARIPLSAAVIDLAKADKSNAAVMAIDYALAEVATSDYSIPDHLRDAHYASAAKLSRGKNYKYPHDYGGFVEQQYLPNEIKNKHFYKPNKNDKI